MKKIIRLATATALAMVFVPTISPYAWAQSLATSAIVAQDHSMRASKLIGLTVKNEHGQTIGKIVDVLVKDGGAEPTVILSVGAMTGGDKMVEAPLSHIGMKDDQASMTASKTDLMAMPAWKFTGALVGNGGG